MTWIEYTYPALPGPRMTGTDTTSGVKFTVREFIEVMKYIQDDRVLDYIHIEVPVGRMAEAFGAPSIRVGAYDELRSTQ